MPDEQQQPEQYSEAWDRDCILPDLQPGHRVTVELWVSDDIEDPVSFVRERVLRDCEITHGVVLSILDVWREDPE